MSLTHIYAHIPGNPREDPSAPDGPTLHCIRLDLTGTKFQDDMGRKLGHLIFLLLVLKEPNMPEGGCADRYANDMMTSIPNLQIRHNPWQCDCKMYPFWQKLNETPAVLDQITCAKPANLSGLKLKDISPEDLICKDPVGSTFANNCNNGTTTSHYHWYFKRDVDSTVDTKWKGPATSTLAVTGSNSNPALHTTNTTGVVETSGLDHQYEDVDQHDQTGQGQSQAITESNTNPTATVVASGDDQTGQGQFQSITKSNTNTTATVMASGDDQTRQGQSQFITKSNTNTTATVVASGHDHRYEDMNHHVTTRQGQSQAITKSNTNTTAVVASSGHDHKHEYMNLHNQTGQGQSRAITESNTNTTATVVASGHDQTGQGQSQANTETLDATNLSYGTGLTVSQLNSLYKTTTVMASGHDQIGQGQSQTITESNTNTTATVMASGHDQTGQGQSQAITESNTNTTATVVASGHDQIGQGQSQAITESNTNTTATVVASGHDQTGQGQSQAITESNTNTTATAMASATVMTSGDDQTKQGQSQAITESNTNSTVMPSGHDQSKGTIQSFNIKHLPIVSTDALLAALLPNPMYEGVVKTHDDQTGQQGQSQAITESYTNTTATVMTSGHDQAGQGQSQTITESNTNTTATGKPGCQTVAMASIQASSSAPGLAWVPDCGQGQYTGQLLGARASLGTRLWPGPVYKRVSLSEETEAWSAAPKALGAEGIALSSRRSASGCIELLNGWDPVPVAVRARRADVVLSGSVVRTSDDPPRRRPGLTYSAQLRVRSVLKGKDRLREIPAISDEPKVYNVSNFGRRAECYSEVAQGDSYIFFLGIFREGELAARYDDIFGATADPSRGNEEEILLALGVPLASTRLQEAAGKSRNRPNGEIACQGSLCAGREQFAAF
ncbi:hypothetical protein Bbelb_251510 [Branchiostoma belcheri]|nr:hypothetical protein Bbelb_251510 [Branchiostoma belcheri]